MHPKNLLLGVLKGLIHRAHQLCDLKEDLLEELALLKDVFISNGYPEALVQKTIKNSWEKEKLPFGNIIYKLNVWRGPQAAPNTLGPSIKCFLADFEVFYHPTKGF